MASAVNSSCSNNNNNQWPHRVLAARTLWVQVRFTNQSTTIQFSRCLQILQLTSRLDPNVAGSYEGMNLQQPMMQGGYGAASMNSFGVGSMSGGNNQMMQVSL